MSPRWLWTLGKGLVGEWIVTPTEYRRAVLAEYSAA